MEALFDGIDLEEICVSMTINPSRVDPAGDVRRRRRGARLDLNKLSGTIQNDILKEYIAQKEWIFPVRAEHADRARHDHLLRARALPRYNPINISGLPHLEAGASALQEVAFTMAVTHAYVRGGHRDRGATSTVRPTAVASSSSARRTSSRRSRSSAPLRRVLREDDEARSSAPRSPSRCGCASTRRPRRPRSRSRSRSTTSSARAPGARGGARRHAVAAHQRPRRGLHDPERSWR